MAEAEAKSVYLAYFLAITMGLFGAHRFYLGDNGSGAVIVGLVISAIAILLLGGRFGSLVAVAMLLVVNAIVLIDLFRLPSMTRAASTKLLNGNT